MLPCTCGTRGRLQRERVTARARAATDRQVYDQPVKQLPADGIHHSGRRVVRGFAWVSLCVIRAEQAVQQLEHSRCARPRLPSAGAQRSSEAGAERGGGLLTSAGRTAHERPEPCQLVE